MNSGQRDRSCRKHELIGKLLSFFGAFSTRENLRA